MLKGDGVLCFKLLGGVDMDWYGMFAIEQSIPETFIRGTLVYLGIFVLLRIVCKRIAGTVGVTDLLLVVLIADAAQNAMAHNYKTITDGFVLIGTLLFWNYFLDWIGFYVPVIGRLITPPPLLLVDHGEMLHRNMRQELLSKDELMSYLREQGVENLNQVKSAKMESDGGSASANSMMAKSGPAKNRFFDQRSKHKSEKEWIVEPENDSGRAAFPGRTTIVDCIPAARAASHS